MRLPRLFLSLAAAAFLGLAMLVTPAFAAPLTREDIPKTKIASDTVVLAGYRAPGDLGAGAVYTSAGATADGLLAVKDAAGTWFNLALADQVSVGWFGAYGDNGGHRISDADIAANPQWRGTYAAGDAWDTVAINEAILAAFAGTSTKGHVVWNSLAGLIRLNKTLFVPTATYGVTRTLNLTAAFFDIDFASRAANWEWHGSAGEPMLVSDSIAYANIKNISLGSGQPAAPGEAAPLWVMDHSGAAGGLATQQITILNATIRTSFNGRGISISPSGGGAQGDTIVFVNPLFVGSRPDYCLRLGGQNALSVMILDGDFQGCTHDAIQVGHGTVYVYGTSFQNQRMGLDEAPIVNQLTTFGADLHVLAGQGPTGVNKMEDARAEDEVPVACEPGAYCDVEDVESAGGSFLNWFASYPYTEGQILGYAGGQHRAFMVVDDGGGGLWRPLGPGSTPCVIADPGALFAPGALAGRYLFVRSAVAATEHHPIASNTANSVTLAAGSCIHGALGAYEGYHVGGLSGPKPPDWDAVKPGGSTRAWGPSARQGFSTSAGSNEVRIGSDIAGRIAVGDYVVIPNAARVGQGIVLPAALFARVEARLGDDRLRLSRAADVSLAYAPGYWGAPLVDHQVSYIDLDFDAFSGAMAVINSAAAGGRASRLGTVINYQSARPDWRREGEPPPLGLGDHQFAGPVSRLMPRPLAYAPVIDLAAALAAGDDLMLRASGDALLNAPAPPPAVAREVTLQVEAAGGPRRSISFGAHFKSAGPLGVEAPAGAVYVIRFVSDGTSWNEASRTGPLTAGPTSASGAARQPLP